MERVCKYCGDKFQAKPADVKRGWGLFCNKSCKAKEQEARTHQYAGINNRIRESTCFVMGSGKLGEEYFSDEDVKELINPEIRRRFRGTDK